MKASQINKSLTGILYRNPAWTRSIPKDIAGFLIYKNNSVNIPITINYRLPGFSFPFKNCNEIMISLDVRMKIKQRDNPRKYRGQQFQQSLKIGLKIYPSAGFKSLPPSWTLLATELRSHMFIVDLSSSPHVQSFPPLFIIFLFILSLFSSLIILLFSYINRQQGFTA